MQGGDDAPARVGAGDAQGERATTRGKRRDHGRGSADRSPPSVPAPLVTPETTDTIRVLHVEDSSEIGELSRRLLSRVDDDFELEAVTNAGAALGRLREGDVDCVLSDYLMPHTDGIEFLEIVRDRHPELPVTLFTAQGDAAVASEAIAAGATDYMRKRLDHDTYETLATRLKAAVRHHDTRPEFWRGCAWFRRQADPLLGVTVVQDGRFVTVTEGLAERFGYGETDLVGKSPLAIVADDDREDVAFLLDRDAAANDRLELTVTADTATGEQFPVALHCGAVSYEGEPALIGVLRETDGD